MDSTYRNVSLRDEKIYGYVWNEKKLASKFSTNFFKLKTIKMYIK